MYSNTYIIDIRVVFDDNDMINTANRKLYTYFILGFVVLIVVGTLNLVSGKCFPKESDKNFWFPVIQLAS